MNRERYEEIYNSLKPMAHDPNHGHPIQTQKDELFELVKIVDEINPQRILEIGMLVGGSLKIWEQLLPKNGLLIGLDIWPHIINTPSWDFKNSDRDIRLIIKDSIDPTALEEVKKILADNLLDFLYIDGCHDIRHVQYEFLKFGSLVRKGGIIGFDDVYNVEGGAVRTLFQLVSHGNEWIMPTLDGGSRIDSTPYAQKTELYPPLKGITYLINYGGGCVGAWRKENMW